MWRASIAPVNLGGYVENDARNHLTAGIGVFIYFERIGKALPPKRWALARAALALSYPAESAPIDLSTLVERLNWDEHNVLMGMLALYAHAPIRWNPVHLGQLRVWAQSDADASSGQSSIVKSEEIISVSES